MRIPQQAIKKAIITRLESHLVYPVYSDTPLNQSFPFIRVLVQDISPNGAKCNTDLTCLIRFEIYDSRGDIAGGYERINEISDLITDFVTLSNEPSYNPLVITNHQTINQFFVSFAEEPTGEQTVNMASLVLSFRLVRL
jgi:hypothetical protein